MSGSKLMYSLSLLRWNGDRLIRGSIVGSNSVYVGFHPLARLFIHNARIPTFSAAFWMTMLTLRSSSSDGGMSRMILRNPRTR
jgi:hypothetical protein